ncbi:hypothetical protein OFM88_23085 [Escherichia coli]|nr:hypothetical protein [Escherichia coli]
MIKGETTHFDVGK